MCELSLCRGRRHQPARGIQKQVEFVGYHLKMFKNLSKEISKNSQFRPMLKAFHYYHCNPYTGITIPLQYVAVTATVNSSQGWKGGRSRGLQSGSFSYSRFFPVLFNPSPSHSNNKNECVTVRFLNSVLHILSGGYNIVFKKSLILTVLKSELRPANTFVEKPCEEKHLQERVVKLKDKVKSHTDLKSKLRRAKNGQKGRER